MYGRSALAAFVRYVITKFSCFYRLPNYLLNLWRFAPLASCARELRYNTRSKNSFRLHYCRTNVRTFSLCFQGSKYLISLALKFGMPLLLLCSILNLSHFSWHRHTLVLLMFVCSFSLLLLLTRESIHEVIGSTQGWAVGLLVSRVV